ncbi:hypothetical protein [Blastomonas sp.]|uniref:hypothetical protein n=1 Tax=Blastomonas sp. TaxID=1909299 RepID=UPI0035931061
MFAFYIMANSYPQQERYQSYGPTQQNQPRAAGAVSDSAATPQNKTPCVEPKTEGEADLCAQWRAALAAENSAEWTKWGVILSAVGISFLLWQIILTRQAVTDTGQATKAMIEANDIARKTAQVQMRAYVRFDDIMVKDFVPGKIPTYQVTMRNVGQTPAHDLEFAIQPFIGTGNATAMKVFFNYTDDAMASLMPLGPGQHSMVKRRFVEQKDADVAQSFHHEGITVLLFGVVSYRDVFGKRHISTFKSFLDRNSLENGTAILVNCGRGNISN